MDKEDEMKAIEVMKNEQEKEEAGKAGNEDKSTLHNLIDRLEFEQNMVVQYINKKFIR